MTLDERIERDLTELYEGKEISCAKNLQTYSKKCSLKILRLNF